MHETHVNKIHNFSESLKKTWVREIYHISEWKNLKLQNYLTNPKIQYNLNHDLSMGREKKKKRSKHGSLWDLQACYKVHLEEKNINIFEKEQGSIYHTWLQNIML